MKKKLFLRVGLLLLITFLLFTFLLSKNFFSGVDVQITKVLQSNIPRFVDIPFSLLSLFGSLEIVSVILLLIWLIYRKLSYIYVLISFAIFHVIELIGKTFVTHPGPTAEFFRYYFSFSLPSSSVQPGSSFPSGHLGRTMFLSVILLFIISGSKKLSLLHKKLLYCFIVVIVALMFISRIYLGEHWFSDVLGGSILGAAMGLLSLFFIF